MTTKLALIIGAGPGISFAFAKALRLGGYEVALASRNEGGKLNSLAQSIGAKAFTVDSSDSEQIVQLFVDVDTFYGKSAEIVLYNASAGFDISGSCGTISNYSEVSKAIQISAIGAFVAAQEAGRRMLANSGPDGLAKGAIFLTGATAGIKGYAKRSVFAMGKHALRGLAQSLYKELSPLGIHVCHFVIDGTVRTTTGDHAVDSIAFTAEAIAQSYMSILNQPRGAWSWELELRSKDEKF